MREAFVKIIERLETQFGFNPARATVTSIIMMAIFYIILLAVCGAGWYGSQSLNKRVFSKISEKQGNKLLLQFLEKINAAAITIIFLLIPFNTDQLRSTMIGSAALMTAVIGFAAQDVIKDILAGLQITFYHPFELGDRIEFEDGNAGIVESITMRHIVIRRMDTQRIVIPNSKVNTYTITQYSYGGVPRSILLRFPVSYKSDIKKVKAVIGEAIKKSPYSIPVEFPDGQDKYGNVYFLDLDSSALIMAVMVYYDYNQSTERVKDSINTLVFEALNEAGIEIPYGYTNVVIKE